MQQRNHEFMQKIHESLDHFNINPKKQLQLEQEHQSLLVRNIEQRHKVSNNNTFSNIFIYFDTTM